MTDDYTGTETGTDVTAAVDAALAQARAEQEETGTDVTAAVDAALAQARAEQEEFINKAIADAIKAERERAAAAVPTLSATPASSWNPETVKAHDDWRKRQETVTVDGVEHALAARAEISPNLHYGIVVDNGVVKAIRLPENDQNNVVAA